MLEEVALGEVLEGAGAAASGAIGTGMAAATGLVGVLTGGVWGMALLFGAGFLVGRLTAASQDEGSDTRRKLPASES